VTAIVHRRDPTVQIFAVDFTDPAFSERAYIEAVTRHLGIRDLRRRISSRADVRTNIVYVSATARYATLSRDLVQALLDALDSMNNLAEAPLVVRTTGGHNGGGTQLTDHGRRIIALSGYPLFYLFCLVVGSYYGPHQV